MVDPLIALLVAALIFGVAGALFWPKSGLLARRQHMKHLDSRVRGEDALKHIHKFEMSGRPASLESVAGALHVNVEETAKLLATMQADKLLLLEAGEFRLTPSGREVALHIIRAHRLWEHYLAEETGFAETEWHSQAEMREHALSPRDADALAAQLGHPTHDPHGDPIPNSGGGMVAQKGQSIATLPLDTAAVIVHLEDEPQMIYAQLLAEGLHLGMHVRVTEVSSERVRFWTNGNEHVVAPIVAANISAWPLPEEEEVKAEGAERLNQLKKGDSAEVISISRGCRGAQRRRLMDLGILPGTKITANLKSPSGDPTAYEVRGALIALRQEQAAFINVRRIN